nr:integrase core domain-containing protein [Puniceibacterium sediminis]
MKEALAQNGPPEIFNTDQGSQFTSTDFTEVLLDAKVKISMDGRGRWIASRMIERLWRSLKYECAYLNASETGSESRGGIGVWITHYSEKRPHSSHGLLTPADAFDPQDPKPKAAASNETDPIDYCGTKLGRKPRPPLCSQHPTFQGNTNAPGRSAPRGRGSLVNNASPSCSFPWLPAFYGLKLPETWRSSHLLNQLTKP